jgi:DNA-binding HxlR family transcriptional regulator
MASKRSKAKVCKPHWCPIEVALEVVGGRWKIVILRELQDGTKRYSELHRALAPITHKMLAQQLRELERQAVVSRHVHAQVPPKVEYALTPLGRELEPLLEELARWGTKVMRRRGA